MSNFKKINLGGRAGGGPRFRSGGVWFFLRGPGGGGVNTLSTPCGHVW
jgi:hypothetical protein